ncbi:MAG: 50S ribosomal protein L10 [Thermoanaerobaculales bacterium]|jgi:large subunit ribosomal protein L10|nr:50S ribosomal protein L10 [Thermoanaerobaculales bacterium]
MLTKEQKREQSEQLKDSLSEISTLFLLENTGLNVNDVNVLRSEIRNSEGTYKVVKNSVVRLAVEGTDLEVISPHMTGPKTLAFTEGDAVALAKVLKTFIKDHPELSIQQAYLDGQLLDAKAAEKIADLPSREELLTKLVYMLQSPIRRLAVALNSPIQQLAATVGQIAEKNEE